MGSLSQFSYMLIDELNLIPEAIMQLLKAAITATIVTPALAVDCEGVNLSRDGTLTQVTVTTTNKVFIFDVLKLGKSVFDGGLREILEDASIEKLMFDCRNDSDALWHLYKVKLDGVVDLQLLEIVSRPQLRRVQILEEYNSVLEKYVRDHSITAMKAAGVNMYKEIWVRRPFTLDIINCSFADTAPLFQIFSELQKNISVAASTTRVRDASKLYADYLRKLHMRKYDMFEQNRYLPFNVDLFLKFSVMSSGARMLCLACKQACGYQYIVSSSGYCIVCDQVWRDSFVTHRDSSGMQKFVESFKCLKKFD